MKLTLTTVLGIDYSVDVEKFAPLKKLREVASKKVKVAPQNLCLLHKSENLVGEELPLIYFGLRENSVVDIVI